MAQIEAKVSKLVVLDHHKSAAEKLTGYQCRCGVVHFDMNKSGARLAWEFFHPDKPVPGLIRYIEDRDICERMQEGRAALWAQGISEVGPYQVPTEIGMEHFHQFLRREIGLRL